MRDDVPELVAVADDAHQQRNLQPDQNPHHKDHSVKNQFESLREGKREHQKRGGKAADDTEEKLNPYEAIREAAIDVAGEGAADARD